MSAGLVAVLVALGVAFVAMLIVLAAGFFEARGGRRDER